MKYSILINQAGIVEANLHTKTDLVDWAIIDYLQQWYFAERKKTIFNTNDNNHYVWINYNHLIQEMPIIGIKSKDAISKRIKKLKSLNLIKTLQSKDNTLYFVLTAECIEAIGWKTDRLSDGNRTGCPMEMGQGLSDGNGTAQTYNNIKQTTNIIKNKKKESPKKAYGDFVKLTEDEYERLCRDFTKVEADRFIEIVNDVFHMKPKVKSAYLKGDHNRLIRNWNNHGYFNHKNGTPKKEKELIPYTQEWYENLPVRS